MGRTIYIVIVLAIGLLLARQGKAPWALVAQHWQGLFAVGMISIFGIYIQVQTFRACLPASQPVSGVQSLMRIWASAGAISLIAPIFAGLAIRTVMLQQQESVGITTSTLATLRQVWLGVETALLLGGWLLLLHPFPAFLDVGWFLLGGWLLVWGLRHNMQKLKWFYHHIIFLKKVDWSHPNSGLASLWTWLQLLSIALNYMVAYDVFGAPLTWSDAGLLSVVTVLASVIVVIPNGLGILDALWAWIGLKHGLALDETVGLVLLLRLGYLVGVISLLVTLTIISWKNDTEK
jgi:hypothetical protein